MQQIIAIHGKMHSGKSTAAEYLKKELRAVVKPFAKPIKDFAYLLGWDGAKDTKGRRLLQLLGTEVGRECIRETLWVDKWQASLESTGQHAVIICDDLRFRNEYEHLDAWSKEVDVLLIHIIRPTDLSWWQSLVPTHASERGISFNLDLKPIVIYNSGTISQLHDKLNEYI